MGEAFSVEINSPEIIVVEDSSDKEGEGDVKRDDLIDRLKRGKQGRRRTRPEPGEGEGAYTPPRPRTQKDHPAH